MYIKNFFLNKKIKNEKIKKGYVFRYVEEIFLSNDSDKKLQSYFSKGKKIQWF